MMGWLITYAVGAFGWAFVAALSIFLHQREEEQPYSLATAMLLAIIWPFALSMVFAYMLASHLKKQA